MTLCVVDCTCDCVSQLWHAIASLAEHSVECDRVLDGPLARIRVFGITVHIWIAAPSLCTLGGPETALRACMQGACLWLVGSAGQQQL